MSDNTELIKQLRKAFYAPESLISDDNLLRMTEGTILRWRIELSFALIGAMNAFKMSLPPNVRNLIFKD